MEVRRIEDPSEFLDSAGPLLLADEARHNLLIGVAGTLRDRPGQYPEFQLWVVERNGGVVGAALRTPPLSVIVAQPTHHGALEVLADAIAGDGTDLPGVAAATPEADLFADAWESRRGQRRRLRRAHRIYRLENLRPVAGVPGGPRVATDADRPLLVHWIEAFAEETLEEVPSPLSGAERVVDARLGGPNSGFLLWEDGGSPVSVAGWGSPTPTGIRVGPVYTPPERRRRGYASAVTAELSARLLAAGRRFCFLYTDLANPTSNKIYMDIGYEPVCDAVDYAFDPA